MKKFLLQLIAFAISVYQFAQTTPSYNSLAIGTNSTVLGQNSLAVGYNSKATGVNSAALGQSIANGDGSVALGVGSTTSGAYSVAMVGGTSNGERSFAVNGIASGMYSIALGTGISSGLQSITLGKIRTNGKTGSVAIGDVNDNGSFGNNADNQIMMRFAGGYKLYTSSTQEAFSINPNGTVAIDQSNLNNGTVNSGIIFGNQSGEGIGSKRTGGGNQYGLDFYTGFTNKMSITNAGNVGIGVSTPGAKLTISNTGEDLGGSVPSKTLRTYSGVLGTNTGAEIKLASFGFKSGNWTSLGITAYRYNGADGWPNAAIVFGYDVDNTASAGSYFTLAGNGNFGIGTVAPNYKLTVVGNILATGSITPSDSRYKKNILPISGALNTVMSLSGFTYLLKTEEFPQMNFESRTQYGLLAQDVETVLPEIIYTGNDGYKGIEYSRIIPLLIEGMKEQQKTIEKQQQQIDDLKKMVDAILNK